MDKYSVAITPINREVRAAQSYVVNLIPVGSTCGVLNCSYPSVVELRETLTTLGVDGKFAEIYNELLKGNSFNISEIDLSGETVEKLALRGKL